MIFSVVGAILGFITGIIIIYIVDSSFRNWIHDIRTTCDCERCLKRRKIMMEFLK